jgi:hypothetical protein
MRPSRTVSGVVFALMAIAMPLPAQPGRLVSDPLLRDFRIALRFGSGQVLIVGGELQPHDTRLALTMIEKLPRSTSYARLQPGEEVYLVQPDVLSRFEFKPATNWHRGARWKVYSGAGPAATVVIRQLAITLYCGIGGYTAAIAEFESPGAATVIDGLRASEYIAAPSQELTPVAGTPFLPVDSVRELRLTDALGELLLQKARGIVSDQNWAINPNAERSFADHVRRMNQSLLSGPLRDPEIRYLRWAPAGSRPLLFAEALWADDSGMPLFACDAVVEEAKELTPLAFDENRAIQMRMGEFAGREWRLEETSPFLNVWKIGNRYFVLCRSIGYEGFQVELLELVRGKGLAPVGVKFGAGC